MSEELWQELRDVLARYPSKTDDDRAGRLAALAAVTCHEAIAAGLDKKVLLKGVRKTYDDVITECGIAALTSSIKPQ